MIDCVDVGAPGVIREPRSVWSVASIDRAATSILFTTFERENFRNGSRWPITLTKMAVSPIGTAQPSFYVNTSVRISVPGRQHYTRRFVPLAAFPGFRTAPSINLLGLGAGAGQVYYKKFKSAVLLPRTGVIELDLTASPATLLASQGQFAIGFHQPDGGLYGGGGRVTDVASVQTTTVNGADSEGPFQPTQAGEFVAGAATTGNPWPPQTRFSPRVFLQQQQSRGAVARTPVDAMSVCFNGRVLGATFTGCRVRVSDGDSHGEWWWRQGAPLSLVFDTITDARVFILPQPITLEPGDTLDVELLINDDLPGSPVPTPNFVAGISFNGFAEIEG